jgi:hypothetical protein
MRVSRALRPQRVDELIMHVLLSIVDDLRNVVREVFDELPKPDGIVFREVVVTNSNGCVQIMNQQPDNVLLIDIGNGHR